jgi:hypothetical protein
MSYLEKFGKRQTLPTFRYALDQIWQYGLVE